jgi:hypothetical protein
MTAFPKQVPSSALVVIFFLKSRNKLAGSRFQTKYSKSIDITRQHQKSTGCTGGEKGGIEMQWEGVGQFTHVIEALSALTMIPEVMLQGVGRCCTAGTTTHPSNESHE